MRTIALLFLAKLSEKGKHITSEEQYSIYVLRCIEPKLTFQILTQKLYMSALLLELIQIISFSVFFGFMLTTVIYKLYAHKKKNQSISKDALFFVRTFDTPIYAISSLLVVLSSTFVENDFYSNYYNVIAVVAFTLTGLIWYLGLVRIQNKQHDMMNHYPKNYNAIVKLDRRWFAWGVICILLTLVSLSLFIWVN